MTENNKLSTMKSQIAKAVEKSVLRAPINSLDLNFMQNKLSRRAFLSKGANLAALGALASSGIFLPKTWADKLIGDTSAAKNRFQQMGSFVGYTPSPGPTATKLEFGSELFSDTIYSEPVVSNNEPFMHGMIEGPSNRARIQSVFIDDNATESDFLDKGYSLGQSELVQLEKDGGGTWSLVHYYHPRGARTDGAKTDGLLKKVIKSGFDGKPTKMLCVTAANSNKFEKSGLSIRTIDGHTAHMIYVELDGGDTDGYLITGTSVNSLKPPYYIGDATTDPITWKKDKASKFSIPKKYSVVDTYTNSGLESDGSYNPANAHSHLVFYTNSNIIIMAIKGYFEESSNIPYPIMAAVTKVPYPNNNKKVRVAHIEWSAGTNKHGLKPPSKVVLCGTTTVTKNNKNYEEYYSYLFTDNNCDISSFNAGGSFFVTINTYHDSNLHTHNTSQRSVEDSYVFIDYHNLRNTHDLFSYKASNGDNYYVKLGNIKEVGLVAFILNVGSNGYVYLVAHYVLTLPETTDGLGKILNFVGGVSKFGGFRFYAIDENGSLFMNRQQRLATIDTPYGAPIYGLFDSTGALANFQSGVEIQVPPDTDEGSELFNIDTTYLPGGSGSTTLRHNLLLNTVLAFSTDISNACQGVCLGAGAYKAVYAPKRFALDSEHIVVKDTDEAGTTQGAFNVHSTLLERSWYSQQITTQKAYSTEVTQDSGDFYHLTISPVDDDGNLAHLSSEANKFLAIEVRADAPCKITDVGSNLYHHIDRYNSFMAEVDSNSGKASLVVKATQFGQNIYARLVDTSTLAASSEDPGLVSQLEPSVSKQYSWQIVNIAEQAQSRMSNTDATATDSYDEDPAFLDTAVYVTGDKVSGTQKDGDTTVWKSKGDYKVSGSDMDNLASFCNQSGSNLITVSNEQQASLYGTDSDPIDPLHNTTSLANSLVSQSSSTYFDYKNGSISHNSGTSTSVGSVGSVWGSVSHSLSDAFHYLQHLAEKEYKNIDKGVTIEINAAASTMVTISKDIMKGVNGVSKDLTEAVDTVEQYASVVVEVLKTVIKNSFMYKFIEMIIMLISLFQYLGDIKDLADNLKTTFFNALKAPPQSKQIASIGEEVNKYIGADGEQALDSLFKSSTKLAGKFGKKVPSNVLSNVVNNPISNKLLGMAFKEAAKASNALDILEFDFSFPATMDPLFTDMVNGITDFTSLKEIMESQLVTDLVGQISEDVSNPSKIYQNFVDKIPPIMWEISGDFIGSTVDIFTKFGQPYFDSSDTTNNKGYNLYFAHQLIEEGSLLKLKLGWLGDLFKLFGLGSGSSKSLKLTGKEAIFFPMALATWVGLYIKTGKSHKSIPVLQSASADGEFGSSVDLIGLADDMISAVFTELSGVVWGACNPPDGKVNPDKEGYEQFSSVCNYIVSIAQFTLFYAGAYKKPFSSGNAFDNVFVTGQLILSIAGFVQGKSNLSEETEEDVSMALSWVYVFLTIIDMFGDVALAAAEGDNAEDAILGVVGGDIMTNVGTFTDMAYTLSKNNPDFYPFAWIIMASVPAIGYIMSASEAAESLEPDSSNDDSGCFISTFFN